VCGSVLTVAEMGLTPRSPVMLEGDTLVIPVLDNTTKEPALPREMTPAPHSATALATAERSKIVIQLI
jgi:hypothetical protein